MKIEYSDNLEFTIGIAVISITIFALLMSVSGVLSIVNEQTYNIHDVRHVEGINDIDNLEEVHETHKLSEIGLSNRKKQQIMDEKDVTTKTEIDIGTVALTIDGGAYIIYVGTTRKYMYKIKDVRHVEGLSDIDDLGEIDKKHELSEIGLSNRKEQQIMDEKDVNINPYQIELGTVANPYQIELGTVALTTDSGSYIVDVVPTRQFMYKIYDVRHVEGINDIDNLEEVHETHKLSESELTHKQKQQIIEGKSVTMTNEPEIGLGRRVLTTDSGSYIVDVKRSYTNTPWFGVIMILVSLPLFLSLAIYLFCYVARPNRSGARVIK